MTVDGLFWIRRYFLNSLDSRFYGCGSVGPGIFTIGLLFLVASYEIFTALIVYITAYL